MRSARRAAAVYDEVRYAREQPRLQTVAQGAQRLLGLLETVARRSAYLQSI